MSEPTIAEACEALEKLVSVLDDAYWEASSVENKDRLYSIISLVHAELAELSKLSIQDHHMPYEIITLPFNQVKAKLNNLRKVMDEVVLRGQTAQQLDQLITEVATLTN